jgi:hypothetical protein
MTLFEFNATIQNICAYYQHSEPKGPTLNLWYDKVKNIPAEPIRWIEKKMFDEQESYPKNIPSMMWALYNTWLAANPHKRAMTEDKNCPDCEGGWLAIEKQVDGYRQKISHSAACGKCKQLPSARYMTLQQAIEQGYNRIDLKTYPVNGPKDIKKLADMVGKKMPEMPIVTWE